MFQLDNYSLIILVKRSLFQQIVSFLVDVAAPVCQEPAGRAPGPEEAHPALSQGTPTSPVPELVC